MPKQLHTNINPEHEMEDLLWQWQGIIDLCLRARQLGFSVLFTPEQLKALIAIGHEVKIEMKRRSSNDDL